MTINPRACLLAVLLGLPVVGEAAQTCGAVSAVPPSTPASRFTDNGNGTVTDNGTGLMWAKCASGLSGASCGQGAGNSSWWGDALSFAAGASLAGYTDWRLPNLAELLSLVEVRCVNPAINAAVFPNTPDTWFWSGSPTVTDASFTWGVNFASGSNGTIFRGEFASLRLVRDTP